MKQMPKEVKANRISNKMSREQKARNRKMFGCENLKVPRSFAITRLENLMVSLRSDSYSIRQKFDLIIANYEETLTDSIAIIKCPTPIMFVGGAVLRIPNSEIVFLTDIRSETQQAWVPFDEWDKLEKDFEKTYKRYIDWKVIARYK